MLLDCDTCQVRGAACGDCVVTALLRLPPRAGRLDLDDGQRAALGVLAGAGLVAPLRLVRPAYHGAGGGPEQQAG